MSADTRGIDERVAGSGPFGPSWDEVSDEPVPPPHGLGRHTWSSTTRSDVPTELLRTAEVAELPRRRALARVSRDTFVAPRALPVLNPPQSPPPNLPAVKRDLSAALDDTWVAIERERAYEAEAKRLSMLGLISLQSILTYRKEFEALSQGTGQTPTGNSTSLSTGTDSSGSGSRNSTTALLAVPAERPAALAPQAQPGPRTMGQDRRPQPVALHQIPAQFSLFILDQTLAETNGSSGTRSRNISCLMGSQATIFSVWGQVHRRPTRAGLEAPHSPNPLERTPAIRFKGGGLAYRMKLALRKLVLRCRSGTSRLRRFFATHKKATSRAQRQPARSGSRRAPKVQILGPVGNPHLGALTGALRVRSLTSELKAMAGRAPEKEAEKEERTFELPPEADGKQNHLSRFLLDQRRLSKAALLTVSLAPPPPPPPHKIRDFSLLLENPGRAVSARLQKLQNQPRPRRGHDPSDHLSSGQSGLAQGDQLALLWRRYLANVLAQRIRLRQEIHLFQRLVANPQPPLLAGSDTTSRRHSDSGAEIASHNASIVGNRLSAYSDGPDSRPVSYPRAVSGPNYRQGHLSYPGHLAKNFRHSSYNPDRLDTVSELERAALVQSAKADHAAGTDFVDVPDTASSATWASSKYTESTMEEPLDDDALRLHKALNRRSMLGQMLDYDSDELASLSSAASLGLAPFRYGTISRRGTKTSLPLGPDPLAAQPYVAPLALLERLNTLDSRTVIRLPGIPVDLHKAQAPMHTTS